MLSFHRGRWDDPSRCAEGVGMLERVYTKKLFVLPQVELDHQCVDGGIETHIARLWYKFLDDRDLTL